MFASCWLLGLLLHHEAGTSMNFYGTSRRYIPEDIIRCGLSLFGRDVEYKHLTKEFSVKLFADEMGPITTASRRQKSMRNTRTLCGQNMVGCGVRT